MARDWLLCILAPLSLLATAAAIGGGSAQELARVVAFYTDKGEPDHIQFAEQAIKFFGALAKSEGWEFSATTDWEKLNETETKNVRLMMWLNDFPKTAQQRTAFETYMKNGGGWLGFHVAAYNDADTHWPWFVDFLGGAVFYGNNWPPLPATLTVEDATNPVTRRLPASFLAPQNEWYIWEPSPRKNKDVAVLLTLDAKNYPIGLKDVIAGGDLPVVWTNTRYRMLYVNMGHGDKIFTSEEQNRFFEDAVRDLVKAKSEIGRKSTN